MSRGGGGSPRLGTALGAMLGFSFAEVLFVISLVAILVAIAVPQSLTAIDRIRAMTAARYLASRMAMARAQAVMRSVNVALQFVEGPSSISFTMVVDGNGNGVRTADIAMGVDRPLDTPASLSDLFPGVAIAVSGSAGSDPVRVGAHSLLSFTPLGTATPGSIYVRGRDGSQFAVRVLGTTGRTRLERYIAGTGIWVDIL